LEHGRDVHDTRSPCEQRRLKHRIRLTSWSPSCVRWHAPAMFGDSRTCMCGSPRVGASECRSGTLASECCSGTRVGGAGPLPAKPRQATRGKIRRHLATSGDPCGIRGTKRPHLKNPWQNVQDRCPLCPEEIRPDPSGLRGLPGGWSCPGSSFAAPGRGHAEMVLRALDEAQSSFQTHLYMSTLSRISVTYFM